MIKNYKKIIAGIIALIAVACAGVAYANPSYFAGSVSTNNAASSTPAFLSNGVATSTLTYDSFVPTTKTPSFKTERATMLVQFAGSSTSAVLGINLEFSQDGIDWYRNDIIDTNQISTTSQSININPTNSYALTYANETRGGQAGTYATSTRALTISTPTRYVRAIFTATGANGTVWATIIPVKELQ